MCKFGYFYIFNYRYFGISKFYFFFSDAKEKLKFEGLLWGQGPKFVYWALGPI